jgi:hypothetical protein
MAEKSVIKGAVTPVQDGKAKRKKRAPKNRLTVIQGILKISEERASELKKARLLEAEYLDEPMTL